MSKLLWICLFPFLTANNICDFDLPINLAILNCQKSPTADDIVQAKKEMEKRDISRITKMFLYYSNISILSPGTFHFQTFVKIQDLDLSHNRIKSLPEEIFNSTALTHLKKLNLEDNKLSYLSSKQFVFLQNLQTLYLSYNRFRTFKQALFPSVPINELRLDGNYIEILPDYFFSGKVSLTLETLTLCANMLREIPHCIFKTNTFNDILPELKVVSFCANNIRELPNELFTSLNFSLLVSIDFSFNNLETLPKYFVYSSALSRLNFLTFSHNRITYLPKEFLHSPYLKNLQEIDLSHNKITDLPDDFFHSPHLQNLETINISFNQISYIPSGFLNHQALENVTSVYLNNNNLEYVTEDMLPVKLLRLCDLNLANNKLSSIGEIISKVLLREIPGEMERINGQRIPCILNISHNHLTVQKTNFIQPYDRTTRLNGYLDLSHNNISKFELSSDFEKQLAPYAAIPFDRKWLDISGNQLFSVINLVEAALGVDLRHIDISKPIFSVAPALFRLNVLIQSFPYTYDCNCDMLKYKTLQKTDHFNKSMERYVNMVFHYDNLKKYVPLTSHHILNNLKCGSPKHLYGKYLS